MPSRIWSTLGSFPLLNTPLLLEGNSLDAKDACILAQTSCLPTGMQEPVNCSHLHISKYTMSHCN